MSDNRKIKHYEMIHGGLAKVYEDGAYTYVITNIDELTGHLLCAELNRLAVSVKIDYAIQDAIEGQADDTQSVDLPAPKKSNVLIPVIANKNAPIDKKEKAWTHWLRLILKDVAMYIDADLDDYPKFKSERLKALMGAIWDIWGDWDDIETSDDDMYL